MMLNVFKRRVSHPRSSRNTAGSKWLRGKLENSLGDMMEGIIYHGCVELRDSSKSDVRFSSKMDVDTEVVSCSSNNNSRDKSIQNTLPVEMDIDVKVNAGPWALILSQIPPGHTTPPKWCQPRRSARIYKRQLWQAAKA
ncbi:hypothetical protein ACHAPT_000386 [Fusarium lateritium]